LPKRPASFCGNAINGRLIPLGVHLIVRGDVRVRNRLADRLCRDPLLVADRFGYC
jgi:hypothetical protein